MKYIQLTSLLICSVLFLTVSCKSDPDYKDGKENVETKKESRQKVKQVTYTDAEIAAAKASGKYSADERRSDSLVFANKLFSKDGSYDPSDISRMLDEEAVNRTRGKAPRRAKGELLNPCRAITTREIAELFDIPQESITMSNGNKGKVKEDKSTSCFWRWGNEGIVVQISSNPLPDEVSDWATRYMNTKKSNGEKTLGDSNASFIFKDFDGPGSHNIYNREMARFYSSNGEDMIIALIYNGNMEAKKQLRSAQEILAKIFEEL